MSIEIRINEIRDRAIKHPTVAAQIQADLLFLLEEIAVLRAQLKHAEAHAKRLEEQMRKESVA